MSPHRRAQVPALSVIHVGINSTNFHDENNINVKKTPEDIINVGSN